MRIFSCKHKPALYTELNTNQKDKTMENIQANDKMFLTSEAYHRSPKSEVVPTVGAWEIASTFDFDVQAQPMSFTNSQGEQQAVTGSNAIVRTGGRDANGSEVPDIALSAVGTRYVVSNYYDYFSSIASTLTEQGCKVETVGTLGNGAKGFMSVSLPEGIGNIDLGGTEQGGTVLNFGDSCDGSCSQRGALAFGRIVCENFFSTELLGMPALWKIQHRTNAAEYATAALATLESAVAKAQGVSETIDRLVNSPFSESEFRAMVAAVQGERPEDTGTGQTVYDAKFTAIMERYNADDVSDVRSTRWGALQAVQGWSQHSRGTRGDNDKVSRNISEAIFSDSDPLLKRFSAALLANA